MPNRPVHLPSPEEIRAACEEIKKANESDPLFLKKRDPVTGRSLRSVYNMPVHRCNIKKR